MRPWWRNASNILQGTGTDMNKLTLVAAAAAITAFSAAKADPVDLSAYADANGFIDVQALTCEQLANTYQEDANALANWYSGWYNGLAKKHYYHLTRVAGVEHELILWCEAHRDKRIIEGLGFLAHESRGPR